MRSEESIRELAYSINQEKIIDEMNRTGRKYLATHNYQFDKEINEIPSLKKGNLRIMNNSKKYYKFLRARAIGFGIDISKHPETLEELTN